jgi:glycosyltransferase involved in cell wall biosynthesis
VATDYQCAPKVSIIIPCYNVARYVAEALDSVLAQTFTDYETIVVNDGSPDTEEFERVMAPYRQKIVYIRQHNRGLAGARNAALAIARGEYIGLLDPDDIWEPNYLAVQVKQMDADPSIDVVYPNAIIFGERMHDRDFMSVFPSSGPATFERILRRECYVMGSALIRREAIVRAGLFDETLRACEDFDLWLRIAKQGYITFHRQPLVRLRRRPESLSADDARMYEHLINVLEKVERRMTLSVSEVAIVKEQRRRYSAELRLFKGKSALLKGDSDSACRDLRLANEVLRRRKISCALVLIRISPTMGRFAYRLHDGIQQTIKGFQP